ncbi:MAG TPA: hypothetical protein PK821_07670 [Victivallales bacterium]|mgnify:CR=1 FL=1|nr:hypothetical protein [Victivallales bacterium]
MSLGLRKKKFLMAAFYFLFSVFVLLSSAVVADDLSVDKFPSPAPVFSSQWSELGNVDVSPESGETESSSFSRYFGAGVLMVVSAAAGLLLLISVILLLLKWRKSGSGFKFLLLGCSIILLVFFLFSLIGTFFVIFYMAKDSGSLSNSNKLEKESPEDSKLVEEYFKIKGGEEADNPKRSNPQEDIAKLAFEGFNRAVKLYSEYQLNGDPELFRNAIYEIETAIEMDASNHAYWLLAGKLYSEMSSDLEIQICAENYLRKSLELDPNNVQALLTLGNCLALQERYSEAINFFRTALSKDARLADSIVPIIACSYIYDQQFETGEKFLREQLNRDPGSDSARISLAIILNMQGAQRSEHAKNELRKVIGRPDASPILKTYASNLLNNFDKWHTVK